LFLLVNKSVSFAIFIYKRMQDQDFYVADIIQSVSQIWINKARWLILFQIWPTFKLSIAFTFSWGSSVNWLELKTKPPWANLACLNLWNALYDFFFRLQSKVTVLIFQLVWCSYGWHFPRPTATLMLLKVFPKNSIRKTKHFCFKYQYVKTHVTL